MSESEKYISSIPKFAPKTELKNTELLLEKLGVGYDDIKIIHVAGTNGKGSVCSYISNILVNAGKRTGLFISPHLVKMNERIQIDNVPVSDELFDEAFDKVMEATAQMEKSGGAHPAYFEFLFGMAMYIFCKLKVEYIVLETGLGGRLDATNIFKAPVMTVIASVSMDHMQILGNTIDEIAAEKAGIIKENVPLVFYGNDKRVAEVMENRAKKLCSPFIAITDENVSSVQKNGKYIDFLLNNKYYDNVGFSVCSAAFYQVWNASLAATAMGWLSELYPEQEISMDSITEGIRTAFWEGRMEEIRPSVYLDGAHNEDGIRAFIDTAVRIKDRKQILMFSAVSDKDYDAMVKEICESGAFDEYVVCSVEYASRAVAAEVFIETFRKYTDKPVYLEETSKAALKRALSIKSQEDRLFIAGSLYLVGEVKVLIKELDSEGLL